MQFFVRNRKFFSSFCPAGCQYTAAIGTCHFFAEPVFVPSFTLRWLKCSFHIRKIWSAKVGFFLISANFFTFLFYFTS